MADISLVRKTTNTITLTFKKDGVATNITDWIVFFTVKKNLSQTDLTAQISKRILVHTDPTHGETTVVLSPTDTDITSGTYFYDIAYVDDSTNVKRTAPGNFIIIPNVTQSSS